MIMKKSYFIYLAASLGIIILGIFFANASFLVFFDPVSIMLTFLPTVFILLAIYSPGEFIGAFRLVWKGSKGSKSEVKNSIAFFKTASKLLLLMGIIGLMLGCILMLSAGWEPKKFAFGLSYALICLLYSFLTIYLVTLPFQNSLEKKLNEMEE
jgi:flagellar motor component MotA